MIRQVCRRQMVLTSGSTRFQPEKFLSLLQLQQRLDEKFFAP
nr:hypothetical protein P5658_05410 [Bacillus subtilis]